MLVKSKITFDTKSTTENHHVEKLEGNVSSLDC